VIEDGLTPCQNGFELLRFIHKIVRAIYPAARILLSEIDIKSAYRRVHFRAELALQSCITTKGLGGLDLALVYLRTTFGGSPCPSIFSEISKTVTDLTNAIIRCSDYDPASFPSHYSHLLGPAKVEPDNVPLAAACSIMVNPEALTNSLPPTCFWTTFSPLSHSSMEIRPETAVPRLPYSHWTSSGNHYSRTAASLYPVTKSLPSTRQLPKAPRRKG